MVMFVYSVGIFTVTPILSIKHRAKQDICAVRDFTIWVAGYIVITLCGICYKRLFERSVRAIYPEAQTTRGWGRTSLKSRVFRETYNYPLIEHLKYKGRADLRLSCKIKWATPWQPLAHLVKMISDVKETPSASRKKQVLTTMGKDGIFLCCMNVAKVLESFHEKTLDENQLLTGLLFPRFQGFVQQLTRDFFIPLQSPFFSLAKTSPSLIPPVSWGGAVCARHCQAAHCSSTGSAC